MGVTVRTAVYSVAVFAENAAEALSDVVVAVETLPLFGGWFEVSRHQAHLRIEVT
nr:hypothetical protein [Haloprofundus salinisoli]